ncbi:MAG: putative toxin-antitoxin system toxin component, PIN family [Deltaproteobacteria bacterium]|nr:putative toxin-antitoxin system toxin component, PIN family [Deltaproteobacteria bacterium]
MAKVRVVLDTNVYVSALLWTGIPHRLLRLAEEGDLALVTSPSILEELRDVLRRPKFRLRIRTLQTSVAELMESLLSVVEVIPDSVMEPVIKRDPDDDKILACAVAAQAPWLISGDDHLLSLKRYNGISIVTPSQFLRAWKSVQ